VCVVSVSSFRCWLPNLDWNILIRSCSYWWCVKCLIHGAVANCDKSGMDLSENVKKKLDVYSSSWNLRATERDLSYGITQCYLPPDTGERTRLNPSHAGRYSIYLPRRDGRLSLPCYSETQPPGVELATSRSRIQCPNHWATKKQLCPIDACRWWSTVYDKVEWLCLYSVCVLCISGSVVYSPQ